MKRTLIKQGGGNGLTIYLPKKWIQGRNLQPGNEINIVEEGEVLVLSTKDSSIKEISVSFTEKDLAQVVPEITHLFRLGYDKMIVKSEEPKILQMAEKKALPLLLGFEITSKSVNSIIIENLSEPTEDKFEVMLRRIFLIIKEMGEQCLANKLTSLAEARIQLDKLCFFCKRALTKKVNQQFNPLIYWELITYLTNIGHAYYYLSVYLEKNKLNKAGSYLKSVNYFYEKLYNAYYKKDKQLINSINQEKEQLVFVLPDKLINSQGVVIAKIQQIARLTQLCSGSVLYALMESSKTDLATEK